MQISPTEAVRQYNVSKPTLYEDMKEGKLSYTTDKKNKRKIDVAELERIYEPRKKDSTLPNVKDGKAKTKPNEEMVFLSTMEKLLERQEEQYKDQIEILKDALQKAQEGQNTITRLLEDQTSGQGSQKWEQSLKRLEARIANQEANAKESARREEEKQRDYDRLKKAYLNKKKQLHDEKAKPFWKKLFA